MLTMGLPALLLEPTSFICLSHVGVAEVLVVPVSSTVVINSFSTQSNCAALPAATVTCFLGYTFVFPSSSFSCLID